MDKTLLLAISSALFLGHHLVLSHAPIRQRLVDRFGLGRFRGGYSAISFVTIAGMGWAFWTSRHGGPELWSIRDVGLTRGLTELLSLLGVALIGGGVVLPAPSAVASKACGVLEVRGATAITRHPVMMGIALWSLGHLLVNGWLHDVLFFGTMLLTAVLGAAHQDTRLKKLKEGYAAFVDETAFFPFAKPSTYGKLDGRGFSGLAAGLLVGILIRLYHVELFG